MLSFKNRDNNYDYLAEVQAKMTTLFGQTKETLLKRFLKIGIITTEKQNHFL